MPLKILRLMFLILFVTVTACGQEELLVSALNKEITATRGDLLTIQQSARSVAEKARECTVGLVLANAMGSGVVISPDGYILTAAHVVSRPDQDVKIHFPNGDVVEGVSLGLHTTADGALIKITESGEWPFMPMIEAHQGPMTGDWCVALGHPQGFRKERTPPVRLGRVIEFTSEVIRTDCTITGGDSGGPLFDMQGRVIGIHSRIAERPSENFHVPVLAMLDAWERLKEGELYPDPIPSEFLAMLDVDRDGFLTRKELTSGYQRAVFDRLVVNFDLNTDEPLKIKTITEEVFQWQEKPQPGLRPLGEELSLTRPLPSRLFVRGPEIEEQFEDIVRPASRVTVRIMAEGIPVGLGVVVREDGLVLTKSSSLKSDDLSILLPSGDDLPAAVVGSDHAFDVALLKVDATDLEVVNWSTELPSPGSWLIVADTQGRVGSLGIVAVAPREIPKVRPVIGVQLSQNGGTQIAYVAPKGGANAAGLVAGDVIVRIAGIDVNSIDEIHVLLDDFRAGDKVRAVVNRDGETIETEVLLGAKEDVFFEMGGGHWEMSGALSRRRDGFPSAIQSDAVIRPSMCGGPMVDADGNVIGITLARADRVSTLGVTYPNLRAVLDKLMSTVKLPIEAPVATKK